MKGLSLRAKLTITIIVIGIIVSGVNFYQITQVDQIDKVTSSLVEQGKATEDIRHATDQIRTMFIVMTVGVTIASVIIGIILMTSISHSLARIRRGAIRIANGDFSAPITIESRDELGQLGQSFNAMADRLRDSYKRLAVEQQRDEAILQNMGEGLIATDEKGNILLINHVAMRYVGLEDLDAAVGKPIHETYELYRPDDKDNKPVPKEERPVYQALSTGKTINEVFAFHGAGDKKILMDTTATPILLNDKVVGAISVMRDVTKEKEIDRMKTEFISLASHQLRTPLSAIKWFIFCLGIFCK